MSIRLRFPLLAVLVVAAGVYATAFQQPSERTAPAVTRNPSLLVEDFKRNPEAIPQMTNTSSCEFKDTRNWVCRDGLTLTAADSGKVHLYRLGPVDKGVQVSHAHLRNYRR